MNRIKIPFVIKFQVIPIFLVGKVVNLWFWRFFLHYSQRRIILGWLLGFIDQDFIILIRLFRLKFRIHIIIFVLLIHTNFDAVSRFSA